MRFFALAAGAFAFAASALAQTANPLTFTSVPDSVTAGKPVTITWTAPSTAPVTIILRKGDSKNLDTIQTITSSGTGGSFTWTPAVSLANGADYALEIQQSGATPNYFGPFAVTGGSASATASATASSGSASAVTVTSTVVSASRSATPSSSAAATSSHSGNSTVSSASLSTSTTAASTSASRTASATGSGSSTAPTGGAAGLSSPMALIFGAVVAIAVLN